jgi:hypothetical protein
MTKIDLWIVLTMRSIISDRLNLWHILERSQHKIKGVG